MDGAKLLSPFQKKKFTKNCTRKGSWYMRRVPHSYFMDTIGNPRDLKIDYGRKNNKVIGWLGSILRIKTLLGQALEEHIN
jgi:hypothetical protein